jgi:hypothetical protein
MTTPAQPPTFAARLRERLSPRTWALEWVALAASVFGLLSQIAPQLWPPSLREQVLLHGEVADATVRSVTRVERRNTRWGTEKKIGARLIVYHVDLRWNDHGAHAVSNFPVGAGDAAKLGLDAAKPPTALRIRYLPPDTGRGIREEPAADATTASGAPETCRPARLCERVVIDAVNSLDAKKFGDRPEATLAVTGLLVFAAMLAVRAIGLIVLG